MSRRRRVLGALTGVALVLVAGRALTRLYVEHAWFGALGLPAIGAADLAGSVLLRGGTTLLATLFLFANLYAVRRSVVSLILPRRIGDLEFGEEVPGPYLAGVAAVIAIVLGTFLGIPGDAWPRFAIAMGEVRFGERDPYFGRDLGFFVTQLPAELELFAWAQRALLTTAVAVVVLYALTPSLRWRVRSLYVSEYVRRHLMVLGGFLLLLLAWGFRLDGYRLLFDGSGAGGAFAAVDLQVRVPGTLVLAAISLAAGVVVIWAGFVGQIRIAFLAVTVMLLLSVVLRYVLPATMGRDAAAAGLERPFLMTRDDFSRRAFGGDRVGVVRGDGPDSALHVAGVHGVSLWDAGALRRSVDGAAAIGWTRDGDAVTAVVVQRGFVDQGEATPWTAARIAAWAADADGAPRADGSPDGGVRHVLQPVVWADTARAYRVVPDASGIVRGAPMTSLGSRLAHAWALQNFRLLVGPAVDLDPTMLLRPQLSDRLSAIVPFLVQGRPARPAILGDTLFWTVELYVASSTYPLSEPIVAAGAERRYFHPAGHAVVNSATGHVRVVPVIDPEPPVAFWIDRFPELWVERDDLPPELGASLLPPPEAARTRALAFARYGRTALDAPPRRRHVAIEHGADSALADALTPVALAGRTGLSIIVPVLDDNDRLEGIVAASGPDATARWIPVAGEGRRWGAVLDTLRAADSTRGRHDARIVRGPVRAVPVQAGIAFVQPTFLWPARGDPTLSAVQVLDERGASTGGPASAAGVVHAGDPSARPGAGRPLDPRALYLRMRDALRRGDWQAFGSAFDALGRALEAAGGALPGSDRLDSLRAPQP